ncbi:MAG: beta-lactamase family protein [Saprospiraceae bacterium]|nr:beta-lactamase family protein [Saprospiraceae bacterium]
MHRLFILLAFFVPGSQAAAQSYMGAIDMATRRISEEMEMQKLPGVAVAISLKDSLIWSAGMGFADLENMVPVDPARSLFRIGSVSKTLTAAALARLYENGLLDLDAEVQTICPDFPKKNFPITVRQVGGHLSGIRHYRGMEFLSSIRYHSVASSLAIFKDDSLLFKPGSKYSYSSYGWNLLSYVIENLTQQEFLDYMLQNVFEPLQMLHTQPDYPEVITPGRVRFYQKLDQELINCPYVDNSYKWAGGGFLSSAEDLIRFGEAHLNNTFVTPETLGQFTDPQNLVDGTSTGYGIGWRSATDQFGHNWVGHSGGSVGGISMFQIYPDHQLTLVILTNTSHAQIGMLASEIANDFISSQ